jgi:hypothetical protein
MASKSGSTNIFDQRLFGLRAAKSTSPATKSS